MQCDILIVGSGISALSLVFHLTELNLNKRIIIASDNNYQLSNSYKAQGGVALEMGDSLKKGLHIEDTLKCGLINNVKNTSEILTQAEYPMGNLIRGGLEFETDAVGGLLRRREAGHSQRRILFHADTSGKHIQQFLYDKVSSLGNVEMISDKFCFELIVDGTGCKGAKFIDKVTGKVLRIYASRTVLATGGCGALYEYTSNSQSAIGSGVALASEVGAELGNMEFIQFHPTVYIGGGRTILLSEALRGEGAKIVSDKVGVLSGVELLTRDKLSRLLFEHLRDNHRLYLDCTHIEAEVLSKFDFIGSALAEVGLDIRKDLVPIQPAAHYMCGGINTDTMGRTSVANLYAIGEVANTGLHGANRLASNSLTEAITVPYLMAKHLGTLEWGLVGCGKESAECDEPLIAIDFMPRVSQLRGKMWASCGLMREDRGLTGLREYIVTELELLGGMYSLNYSGQYYKKMLEICLLIVEASLKRRDSVGTFWKIA
jgi:L-aspartate oxidase